MVKCEHVNECPSATEWCMHRRPALACIPFIINAYVFRQNELKQIVNKLLDIVKEG